MQPSIVYRLCRQSARAPTCCWLRLEPFELQEPSSVHAAIEDCPGAHSYQACLEQRIQTLEVDVNISWPAVIQAWKAQRNKMKRGELGEESRWGETIFATLEERSSRSHDWCSCWDTSSSALHWQKHQRKWSTAKIKIKLVGEGGAHRSQAFWTISITCLLF